MKLKCKKCGTPTKKGKALQHTIVFSDDFGGDAGQHGTTMNYGPANVGPHVNMIDCEKCPKCGHSFTVGHVKKSPTLKKDKRKGST